jgi:hypothetical protein
MKSTLLYGLQFIISGIIGIMTYIQVGYSWNNSIKWLFLIVIILIIIDKYLYD